MYLCDIGNDEAYQFVGYRIQGHKTLVNSDFKNAGGWIDAAIDNSSSN